MYVRGRQSRWQNLAGDDSVVSALQAVEDAIFKCVSIANDDPAYRVVAFRGYKEIRGSIRTRYLAMKKLEATPRHKEEEMEEEAEGEVKEEVDEEIDGQMDV